MTENYDILSLLVLGLVAERPRHAYEVEACIQERNLRKWTAIGFSSIYARLDRLEKQGLVTSAREQPGKRPARRVYRPTAMGRKHLAAGVAELLREPLEPRSTVAPALMLAASAPPAELAEALRDLAERASALLAELASREAATTGSAGGSSWAVVVSAIFAHDRALIEAEARWATDTARVFEELASRPSSSPSSSAASASRGPTT